MFNSIEQLFKDRCAEFKQEPKLNPRVLTPAESLVFTAMTKFKEKYGIIPNVSENKFFTNSMHVPVWKEMSPFEKIDIESQLTRYSSAGCITYVELDAGVKNNLSALEVIINYAMDHDISCFAVNVPVDCCEDVVTKMKLETVKLCDGRFEITKKDSSLKFVGLTNQRVIDMKKTLEKGYTVLFNTET